MKRNGMYILLVWCSFMGATQDLEHKVHDMVLSTQQIVLDEYPHAFNPSIVRFNEKLLVSFRVIPDEKEPFTSWLGLVWLDEDFKQISPVQKLDGLRDADSSVPPRMEDGRLLVVDNALYLIYSDNEDVQISRGGFRMYLAKLEEDNGIFTIVHKERISFFDGSSSLRREKNWAPFVYDNKIFLSYSLSPHKVFVPIIGTNSCKMISKTYNSIPWQWGDLRGGTPALKQDDHYLGFFHSFIKLETVHCPKKAPHYFMGAYKIESEFPFRVTHVSKAPIIGKNFYHGNSYKPYWGTVQVVFPGGFIQNDETISIVYGRQDHEMWVTHIDKKQLYESFVPVEDKTSSAKRHLFCFIKDFFEDLLEHFFGKDNS